MDNEEIQGVKFSEFPSQTPGNSDEVVGLHSGDNARFSIANIVAAVRNGLANIFVPKTDVGAAGGVAELDSTGKVPSTQLPPISSDADDITYDPTISGATATNVQDALDEAFSDLDDKQDEITASGILKGDGQGGVSAATAGTDYQVPLTAGTDYATPAQLADKANQSQLAYVETGTTATRNYTAGQYISLNGLLYTADTAIASGATFYTSGGNKNLTECVGGGFNSIGISQDVSGITWGRITKRNGVVTIKFTLSANTVGDVKDYQLPDGYYRQGEDMFLEVMYRPQGTVSYYAGFIGIINGQITVFQYTRSYGSGRVDAANTDTILGTVTYLV